MLRSVSIADGVRSGAGFAIRWKRRKREEREPMREVKRKNQSQSRKEALLQGNEAVVEGRFEQDAVSLQGTHHPGHGDFEILSARLPQADGTFIQMEMRSPAWGR